MRLGLERIVRDFGTIFWWHLGYPLTSERLPFDSALKLEFCSKGCFKTFYVRAARYNNMVCKVQCSILD